jgi:hypothetical protein
MDDEGNDGGLEHQFGHPFYIDGGRVPRYRDNHEEVDWPSKRPCPRCGGLRTPEGHDPCIANLPGVTAACCGHGIGIGYILFEDHRAIYFALLEVSDPFAEKLARRRIIAALKVRANRPDSRD